MTDRIDWRIWRLMHAITDRSAGRTLRFLRQPDREMLSLQEANIDTGPVALHVPAAPATTESIPAIVFQTWKSRAEIPLNYRYWRQTFIDLNPDTEIVLWDDEDNRRFIADTYAWFLPIYDSYPREIFRADAVRFFFLFEFGGLYADMDSECLRPLNLPAKERAVLLGWMGVNKRFEHALPNAIMASRPRQLFWLLAILRMMEIAQANPADEDRDRLGPEEMTGPILLKRTFHEFGSLDEAAVWRRLTPVLDRLDPLRKDSVRYGATTTLGPKIWYPLDWTNYLHKKLRDRLRAEKLILSPAQAKGLFPQAEIVTYWSHSW